MEKKYGIKISILCGALFLVGCDSSPPEVKVECEALARVFGNAQTSSAGVLKKCLQDNVYRNDLRHKRHAELSNALVKEHNANLSVMNIQHGTEADYVALSSLKGQPIYKAIEKSWGGSVSGEKSLLGIRFSVTGELSDKSTVLGEGEPPTITYSILGANGPSLELIGSKSLNDHQKDFIREFCWLEGSSMCRGKMFLQVVRHDVFEDALRIEIVGAHFEPATEERILAAFKVIRQE